MRKLLHNRVAVLAILGVIVAAGAGWFGYWRLRADAALTSLYRISAEFRAEGWQLFLGAAEAGGAPNRLDIAIDGAELESADAAWRWNAPRLELKRLIYRDDYMALFAGPTQQIDTPFGRLEVEGDSAASLIFAGDRLASMTLELGALRAGDQRFEGGQVDLRPAAGDDPERYRFFLRLHGGPDGLRLAVHGEHQSGGRLGRAPLSLPPPRALRFADGAVIAWPDAELKMRGRLERSDDGFSGDDWPDDPWEGLVSFETDQAAIVIERLIALGLLNEAPGDRIRARIAASGRLAGVLSLGADGLRILDIGPEAIDLSSAGRQVGPAFRTNRSDMTGD